MAEFGREGGGVEPRAFERQRKLGDLLDLPARIRHIHADRPGKCLWPVRYLYDSPIANGALSEGGMIPKHRNIRGRRTRKTKENKAMFAVLKSGGKQYKVQAGDVLRVEKLNAAAGEKVQFNEILMVGSTLGTPLVDGACVQAEVIDQIKADKVVTYVKRRRKHSSQRTRGHRQQLTLLRVTDVLEKGADKSKVKPAVGARTKDDEIAAAKPAKAKKPAKKDAAADKPAADATEA
ncbi:50S ribosomal protein L21 [Paracoccus saliphilus]